MPPRAIKPLEQKPESSPSQGSPTLPVKTPTHCKARGKITKVACAACQKRKRKCNGVRPVCAACEASGKVEECTFAHDSDQTRSSAIRTRNTELESEVRRLQALLEKSRSLEDGPEQWKELLHESVGEIESLRSQLAAFTKGSPVPAKHERPQESQKTIIFPTEDGAPPESYASSLTSEHRSEWSDREPNTMVLDPLNNASIVLGSHQFREGAQHADSHGLDDHELARTFGAYPIKYELLESHLRMPIQDDQRRSLAQPSHCLQPLNFEDFPPDDGIATVESMSSFISAFRGYASRLVAQGVSPDDILGPVGLDVQAFFKKDDFRQARTVSTFVPRFVANFDLLGLKEKLAFSVTINLVLRWQLFPNLKTYNAMPDWLRPTPAQCFLPHFSSIDYLAWPGLRDTFIHAPHQYINIVSAAFKFQWPHPDADLFAYDSVSDFATGISPDFTNLCMDLYNWTLDDQILDLWPGIEGKARFVKVSPVEGEREGITAKGLGWG